MVLKYVTNLVTHKNNFPACVQKHNLTSLDMEYRSPLGCNFKLEQSLINLSKSESTKEAPKKDESPSQQNNSSSRNSNNNDRFSRGNMNSRFSNSPGWQRKSNNWNSPNARHSGANESVPISQYFHPSMLENPWEELEKNMT